MLAGTDTFVFVGSGLVQTWRAVLGAAAAGPHVLRPRFLFILLSLACRQPSCSCDATTTSPGGGLRVSTR